jgi:hypothetical protein
LPPKIAIGCREIDQRDDAIATTDVPIDSWSTGDWIVGVVIAMSLLLTAFLFGIAYERRRHQKPGAGDAQRVGTGFSPR